MKNTELHKLTCKYCGKEFFYHRIKKYCSPECRFKYHRTITWGKIKPQVQGVSTNTKIRKYFRGEYTFRLGRVKSSMNVFGRETCRILACHIDKMSDDPERLKTDFIIDLIADSKR